MNKNIIFDSNEKINKLKFLLVRFNNQVTILLQDIDRKNELLKVYSDDTKNILKKEIDELKIKLNILRIKISKLEIIIRQEETKLKRR